MNALQSALSLAVTAAEIAWPIILVLCFALMVFPFVFLFLAKRGSDPDAPSP
jgi:hypothetical protein